MRLTTDFAILTPVPEQHLRSGASVAATSGYVALGNDNPAFFDEVDELRAGNPVPVLVYASQRAETNVEHRATWFGWYVGRAAPAADGRHPLGDLHRPSTTVNDGAWKTFYHVVGLRELTDSEVVPVASLEKFKSPGEYRMNAKVRGAGLVRLSAPLGAGITR